MIIVLKATLAILLTFALVAAARRARASLRHLLFASLFLFLLLLPFASRVTVSRTRGNPLSARPGGPIEPRVSRGRSAGTGTTAPT